MSGAPIDDTEFRHEPVLLRAVVDSLAPVPPGWVVDGTVGGAGHAVAILDAHPHLSVLGLDRDPRAVAVARHRLAPYGARAAVLHLPFDQLPGLLLAHLRTDGSMSALPALLDRPLIGKLLGRRDGDGDELVGSVDGVLSAVLLDLGVSSPQLDEGERGFSYRQPGPVDMRMDPTTGEPASELVNHAPEAELAGLIRRFGDERHAGRIARAIVSARPIADTAHLAEVVRQAVPAAARRTGGHPATRTFQALRIAVNDELGQLQRVLGDALDLLVPGGRCAVITYHSGEDRIVARRFRDAAADDCVCPPGVGACSCGGAPSVRLVPRKAIVASDEEVAANPRARSARLRVAERLPISGLAS